MTDQEMESLPPADVRTVALRVEADASEINNDLSIVLAFLEAGAKGPSPGAVRSAVQRVMERFRKLEDDVWMIGAYDANHPYSKYTCSQAREYVAQARALRLPASTSPSSSAA